MRKATNPSLNYGRDIISDFIEKNYQKTDTINILDIGCGYGGDLLNAKQAIGDKTKINLYGIEIDEQSKRIAETRGIIVKNINIETDEFPFQNNFFDIIIINQVLEHTKEIFFITSQINRILKTNGLLIIGLPNLASLHNRILLLIGQQPTCIRVFGPHVRGFTKSDLIRFFNKNGFSLLKFAGSNFYPFPKKIAQVLSKLFPTLSVGIFGFFKKTSESMSYQDLAKENFETNFKI